MDPPYDQILQIFSPRENNLVKSKYDSETRF